jgi:hypothetical protein
VPGTTERHPAVSGNQRLSGGGQPHGRERFTVTARSCQAPLRVARHGLWDGPFAYSHSMVLGGLLEMSSATRFTPGISLMMRLEIRSSRS